MKLEPRRGLRVGIKRTPTFLLERALTTDPQTHGSGANYNELHVSTTGGPDDKPINYRDSHHGSHLTHPYIG